MPEALPYESITTVYLPAYTRGVVEIPVRWTGSALAREGAGFAYFWPDQRDTGWFTDRAAALAAAEAMRLRRLASLRRQIDKLEKLGPFA